MIFSVLILEIKLPGCRSLKQKRSMVKPLVSRLHKEFNISAAEVDKNDLWDESVIACGLVTNEKGIADAQLNSVLKFVERYWRDVEIIQYSIIFL
ncbi:MAG: DUF503 domain-containing protein [Chloroflexi bacterium]|nr:DUF503 domain-containing protein [Chloroflexota bacterium]